MLDAVLRSQTDTFLVRLATRLAHWRIRADALTAAAFICGIAAVPDIGHHTYLFGLGLLVLSRVFDIADGAVARVEGPTAAGPYLDCVLYLIQTAAVPFGFGLAEPDRALAAMFLMLGLVARTAVLSADTAARPGAVGIVLFFGGDLVGKTELFAAFALACIFPEWFSIIAYVVGIACFVMAGCRVAAVTAPSKP